MPTIMLRPFALRVRNAAQVPGPREAKYVARGADQHRSDQCDGRIVLGASGALPRGTVLVRVHGRADAPRAAHDPEQRPQADVPQYDPHARLEYARADRWPAPGDHRFRSLQDLAPIHL